MAEHYVGFPAIDPFPEHAEPRDQALKVLEEAAELVEAIKGGIDDQALYEFCDVLQALGNLASIKGWDFPKMVAMYGHIHENNTKRGRYGERESKREGDLAELERARVDMAQLLKDAELTPFKSGCSWWYVKKAIVTTAARDYGQPHVTVEFERGRWLDAGIA